MVQNPCVPTSSRTSRDSVNRWTMALSGRKSITIDAPILITSNKIAVWMDEDWMFKFFDFMKKHKFQFSGLQHKNKKLKLTFVTAKECTMFALKYASRKK